MIALATASIFVAGSGAMAQPRASGHDWMAAAAGTPADAFNLGNPLDAYDASSSFRPFGGSHPWGSAATTSSQMHHNPALDRAKGNP